MNENINLCEILRNAPKGTKLWTPIHGEMELVEVNRSKTYPIKTENDRFRTSFTSDGRFYDIPDGECILFPSRDQRDWSKFVAPETKERVNLKDVLKPFSRVLVRDAASDDWKIALFSHNRQDGEYPYVVSIVEPFVFCIPYEGNEHLLGTADDPDTEYYWEE